MDRLARSAARRAVAEHPRAPYRITLCGRRRYRRHVDVLSVNGSAWFDGVVRCRNRMCPVCWVARRSVLAREIGHVVNERMRATARMPVLATFTVRHSAQDPVQICKAVRSKCWRRFIQGRWWDDEKARFGLSWIAAEEVTRGDNGWHPHMHVLLMPARDAGDVRAMRGEWFDRWAHLVQLELGAANVPNRRRGLDMRYSDRAEYLSKIGLEADPDPRKLGIELTDAANVKGRAPLALMQRVLAGDVEALDHYVTLQLSRHRCRDVTMSQDLRALRDTMPPAPEPETALQLRGSEYDRLAAQGGEEALLAVLDAVATGQAQAKAQALLGAPLAGVEPEPEWSDPDLTVTLSSGSLEACRAALGLSAVPTEKAAPTGAQRRRIG